MAVRFIIDSASDILPKEAASLGLIHIPMKVAFGEEQYLDAVDLSHRSFYEKLVEGDVLPTTSLISPGEFMEACETVVSAGDTAVIVTVSSKLSGTYQSALIAAEAFGGKVFVVDSESVCVGERILIMEGLKLAGKGFSASEIAAELDKMKKKIRVLALLDTLEYLKKGGRISATTAFAGTLLSIKPVVGLVDGKVEMIGKARGSRQGNNLLRELILKGDGVDFSRSFSLAYSGLSDALLWKYIADSADLWQEYTDTLPISTVGCTIGTHVGPGAIAVAFFEK